jgi:hypothetical protein
MRGESSCNQFVQGGFMKNDETGCRRSRKALAVILMSCGAMAGFVLSGCATIIHGTRQDVGIGW